MDLKKNFLLICNAQHYIDNIADCNEYNQVQTFFIKRELEQNGFRCEAYGYQSWMGLKKRLKSTFSDYKNQFDFDLYKKFDNIFFVGAIPLKNTAPEIIKDIRENISGVFAETNEYRRGPKGDIEFFCLPDESTTNSVWIGPMYDEKELYPEKQYDILTIHIDHHFEGRKDCHEEIVKRIKELDDNEFFKQHWKGYELYYHSKKIEAIDDLDFYNRPPNIPFSELASIYRKCHIGFLSHKETMGMYPFEMLAAGASVVALGKMLPPSITEIVKPVPASENFWDHLLPQITPANIEENINKVKMYSYKAAVSRIIKSIEDLNK